MQFIDLKSQYQALRESIDARIANVLAHGQYILGPEVRELEERLAGYSGAKHCLAVASGTDALLIAMMALDLKPGDEVITTPFTFVSTVETIVLLGARTRRSWMSKRTPRTSTRRKSKPRSRPAPAPSCRCRSMASLPTWQRSMP
jgi:cystathionine beta-lyase/cystathionine gamma-synthase